MKRFALTLAAAGLAAAAMAAPAAAQPSGINTGGNLLANGGNNAGIVLASYRPGYNSYRCRKLYILARQGSHKAAYLYRRYCRGHHVSQRQCRKWYVLGYKYGNVRYQHLYRRYCRPGHASLRQCRKWYVLGFKYGNPRAKYLYKRFCRFYR